MKGKIFLVFNLLFPLILSSFETMGSFWPEKIVWITSLIGGAYNSWVYYSTWHWHDKNY